MSKINRDFPRPTAAQIEAFRAIGAATAHEAFGRRGAVDSAIKPTYPGIRILGPAFTLKSPPGDNLTLHAALKLAKPGDVLVVDAGDYPEQGSFGDVMATSAKALGLAGLVTNGGVRDAASIRDLGFPIFTRAVSIRGTIKESLGPLAEPIVFGGIHVNPGDLVIGDDDGLVIIPLAEVDAVLDVATKREAKEAGIRAELAKGRTTWDISNFNALLKRNGLDLEI
ncbi:4-hydroxy-4-methyl-2-oxoglutarate aldolase [Angulomicrobium tetraedrale]|uniref:Putative 4-hydroxy-4-methyl-2-oxoglutarate aldolase n=1 Tax=Ancylobacter tetraedralis TaxID=217068 RepID=A0A839Z4W2_9HYPH|nr:4-carboxy-4-hydroxy-2-oxoadipate aldolase/oxaloacetate decarboxylase [Ancylobacter tetraedralis]MBB3770033.1 4-hydroxy-4-methyl-2-oxoglutarate aldolase [Ancylobacter tetraedralis]